MRSGPVTRPGILRDPGFGCYWLARTFSLIGDYAFRVAFVIYIISVTHSAMVLAVATAVLLLPPLAVHLAGVTTGGWVRSRRRLLVVADAARCVTLLLIAAGTLWTDNVALLVGLAALIGIADGFVQPVSFGYLMEIIPRHRLVTVNSALSVSQQIGLVVGPLLGGLLVAVAGPPATFGLDAVTFLASGVLLLLTRPGVDPGQDAVRDNPASTTTGRRRWRRFCSEVADGARYVTGVPWLLVFLAVGACVNGVYAGVLDVVIPLILSPEGTRGAETLGGYYALQGFGTLIGVGILTRLAIRRPGLALHGMLAMMASALAVVGVVGSGSTALAMAVVYGIGLHLFNSLFPALMRQRVPESLASRVGRLAFLGFNGMMPLGALAMGPLVTTLNARNTAVLAGVIAACAALAGLLVPNVRRLRNDPLNESGKAVGDSQSVAVPRTS
jgi:predicted MFS family arabinose efflux permease